MATPELFSPPAPPPAPKPKRERMRVTIALESSHPNAQQNLKWLLKSAWRSYKWKCVDIT
jgi:hypothetical protein